MGTNIIRKDREPPVSNIFSINGVQKESLENELSDASIHVMES